MTPAEWQTWTARRRAPTSSSSSSPTDRIGGFIIGSGELHDLDAKIRQLVTDVAASPTGTASTAFMLAVTDFAARWDTWRAAHESFLAQSGLPNFDSGGPEAAAKVGAEFQAFTAEYNEMRRQFLAAGGKTDAPAAAMDSGPLDRLASVAGDVVFYGFLGLVLYLFLGSSK